MYCVSDNMTDDLNESCKNTINVYCEKYDIYGNVSLIQNNFVLDFEYDGVKYNEILCLAQKEARMFIQSISVWRMEDILSSLELEKAYELCIKAKR